MKITKIYYNWVQVSDSRDAGCDWELAEIGEKDCVKIEEHKSQGEGDKWYYDIHFKNGDILRTFNPNEIVYEHIKVKE